MSLLINLQSSTFQQNGSKICRLHSRNKRYFIWHREFFEINFLFLVSKSCYTKRVSFHKWHFTLPYLLESGKFVRGCDHSHRSKRNIRAGNAVKLVKRVEGQLSITTIQNHHRIRRYQRATEVKLLHLCKQTPLVEIVQLVYIYCELFCGHNTTENYNLNHS